MIKVDLSVSESPVGPVYGDGGKREPRLRGLGHAGKGADRLPWLLNDLPVTEGGAGLDHELCEL